MESFLRKFVMHLLKDADEKNSQDASQVDLLYLMTIRGDSDHYCKADVIMPLKSAKLRDIALKNPSSLLSSCIKDPSESLYERVREIFTAYNIPLEKIWTEKNLLCFSLKRTEIIQVTLRDVLEAGNNYGKLGLLHLKKVTIVHDTSPDTTQQANIYRGHVIFNHIVKCLRFGGASVQTGSYGSNVCKLPTNFNETDIKSEEKSLNNTTDSSKETPKENRLIIYFVSHSRSVHVDNAQNIKVLKYMHLVNTNTGKAWKVSAEDHFKILLNELRRSMELKYGDINSDEGTDVLMKQAWQCMTLHLLSKNYSDNLRIQVNDDTQNSKDWAFVLYNYARLKMIFKSFEDQVAEGDFEPLPDIKEVNFSLLKYKEEWVLVWEYIIRWPEIVEEFAASLEKNIFKIKTSVITKFMHSLSHQISVYYSRFHVLASEPLPHLLPLMYARLYLLKSVLLLMDICFNLLGIDSPPECM